jgi:hypothetical protein
MATTATAAAVEGPMLISSSLNLSMKAWSGEGLELRQRIPSAAAFAIASDAFKASATLVHLAEAGVGWEAAAPCLVVLLLL